MDYTTIAIENAVRNFRAGQITKGQAASQLRAAGVSWETIEESLRTD